jgi:CubicO group peptidase (beta-lactamase class C family)
LRRAVGRIKPGIIAGSALLTHDLAARLELAVERLTTAYPGPGGACAVLKDGEVLARHAWGFINAERRIAFTPRSLFRMCSITKQFTCAAVLDAFADMSVLDEDVRARLPRLEGAAPGALQLAHNQSGLRDYWAVAMLHGSPAEAPFGDAEAAQPAVRAGHALFLLQPELPHPLGHPGAADWAQLRRGPAHQGVRPRGHGHRHPRRRHPRPAGRRGGL